MAIDKIEKKLSNIPLLRKRITVNPTIQADKDDFMDKYETTNDHLANITVIELNTVISQTNTTIGQINTAVDTVVAKEALMSPHYTAIESVYANEANINAVNDNSININKVASNATNINAVNANKTNIDAVALNEINIDAVATNETNINNVSTNMPKITNVDTNMSDINLVADAIAGGTLPTIIDDISPSTLKTYSSSKIESEISTAVGSIDLSSKQDTLVSGTNIKTIAGNSLLGSGDIPQSVFGGQADYQEFTTSGTWTKPVGCRYVYVEVLGGGGGGHNATDTARNGGGGGGAGVMKILSASTLGDTVAVIIGAGGAGGANGTTADGTNGGDSSFGTYVVAKGGKKGGIPFGGTSGGADYLAGGGGEVLHSSASQDSITGTGGFSSGCGGLAYRGGNCVLGGGGGGGVKDSTPSTGGTSQLGGNGGNGNGTANTKGGDGSYPSGGGGASTNNGGGGGGANGRVRVWTW